MGWNRVALIFESCAGNLYRLGGGRRRSYFCGLLLARCELAGMIQQGSLDLELSGERERERERERELL
jgi:hypothetical protein